MSKQFEERFSALIDGEESQTNDLFQRIQEDDELRQRWQRYHLVSDAIKGHLDGHSFLDISSRVSQALEKEATVLAPKQTTSRLNHWYKQAAGFAVAATVATVAVITVQQNKLTNDGQLQAVAINVPAVNVQFASVNSTQQSRLDSAVETKLSGYLVQHNEYSVTSKMQGALPYMRIVSVTPGKRIAKIANEK